MPLLRRALALSALLAAAAAAAPAAATPALLVDVDSGRVLYQEDATRPWFPASVTKLMTTYVALSQMREGRVRPETLITFSVVAEAQQPSKMGFKAGTQITLENALRMLMVKSANDVAVAIAEHLGGSVEDFAAEMNRHAGRLGMTGSHFRNPHGLPDPEQFTTARDMAVLARALIREFPQAERLFSIPAIRLGKIRMRNHNALLHRYAGADGMKTGFICASGFNLVASATRGGKRLIAVVFGAGSGLERAEHAAMLLERGFAPSFSLFGGSQPQLDSLANLDGVPVDMRDTVCGRGKKRPSESDDDAQLAGSTTSDPDGIYATARGDRGGSARPGQPQARPTALGDYVFGEPVAVYVGPARGDTMLAGIAPRSAPAAAVAAAVPVSPVKPAPPRAMAPAPAAVVVAPTARGQIVPSGPPITASMAPAAPGAIARSAPAEAAHTTPAAAFAPVTASGGFAGPVPIPRPRPRP